MLNILVISETGEGYGLATILTKERSFVKFYSRAETGRGIQLPKKIDSIEESSEKSDITICCQNTRAISRGAQRLASMGRFVIGSSGLYTKLLDRDFRDSFLKLTGEEATLDTEYDYEVWRIFNGNSWLPFSITNNLNKRIWGVRGALCNSTSNLVSIKDTTEQDKVFEEISSFLVRSGFVGFLGFKFSQGKLVDVATELNVGMLYALREILLTPLTEILLLLMSGEKQRINYIDGWGASIMLSIPPFPFIQPRGYPMSSYLNFVDGSLKHFVTEDVVKDNDIQYTGSFGVLGWVTANGITIREAKRRIYRTIGNIVVSKDVQYSNIKEVKNATSSGILEESNII